MTWQVGAGVLASSLALRLGFLSSGLFHSDSVHQARAVEATVANGSLEPMHGAGYPGQVVVGTLFHLVRRALGAEGGAETSVLIGGAVVGALAVLIVLHLTTRLLDSVVAGVAAAAVWCVFPVSLSVDTYAMSHGTETACVLLAFLLGLRALRGRTLLNLIVAGVALGFAASARPTAVLCAPALLVLLWKRPVAGRTRPFGARDLAIIAASTLAAAGLVHLPILMESGVSEVLAAGEYNAFAGLDIGRFVRGLAWATTSVTWPGWLLVIGGWIVLARERPRVALFAGVWLAIPFLYLSNTATASPRHVVVCLAALTVPMAAAVAWLWLRRRTVAVAALALQVAWASVTVLPVLSARRSLCGPKAFAETIRAHTEPDAVVYAMDLSFHIAYYAGRDTRQHPVWDHRRGNFAAELPASLAETAALLSAGTPVYVTTEAFRLYDMPTQAPATYTVVGIGDVEETIGAWGLDLVQRFGIEHVVSSPYEDWHRASLRTSRDAMHLYRLRAP